MVHGVTKNADLDPTLLQREIRPLKYRIRSLFAEIGGFVVCFLGFMAFVLPFSPYATSSDIFILVALMAYLFAKRHVRKYPHRHPFNPLETKQVRVKGKKGKDKYKSVPIGDGIILIGNDLVTNESFWVSNDDARTHMLVFGSTGSGKTRFLLSLFYQALVLGSGVMYVDGKGDTTVFGLVFSMVRRLGREDDLLVINYLTGSKTDKSINDGSRLSNTTNPFALGPAKQIQSLVASLMRDGGGDDMWKGRANALLLALLDCLVYLRDTGEINLDVGVLRDNMPLDRILDLTQRADIPEKNISLLNKYLLELPGYQEKDARQGELNAKCYEQHNYLTMQLTEVLQELSATYSHIFNAPRGEVDYKDLVYNRRILFVMLPALEKEPDALAGLGKLVVAGVRSALAPALGEKVEGSHAEVIDAKPTNSDVPFMLILDEYGYYSVKGFSVVAAQARSLGISVVFAGQDFPSFQRSDEKEAKSIVANTNIKIFMKLEDAKETLDLAIERAGEAETASSAGYEVSKGMFPGYADNNQSKSERKKRINVRDLVDQKPGQAHVIFGDKLARVSLYFTDPEKSPEYRINRMLMVNGPSRDMVKTLRDSRNNITKLFDDSQADSRRSKPVDLDRNLQALFNAYDVAVSRAQEPDMAAKIAFGMMEHKEKLLDDEFVASLKGRANGVSAAPAVRPAPRQAPIMEDDSDDDLPPARPSAKRYDQEMDTVLGNLSFLHEEDDEEYDTSILDEADDVFKSLSDLMSDSVKESFKDYPEVLSADQKDRAMPIKQLLEIEKAAGRSELEAMEEARRGLEIIDETINYPVDPQPNKLTAEGVSDALEQMLARMARIRTED